MIRKIGIFAICECAFVLINGRTFVDMCAKTMANKLDTNILGAKALRAVVKVVGKLPLGFHYCFGRVMSWFLSSVMHYRYDVVLTNISRSFPDQKYGFVKKTAKEFYRHLGEIAAETIWFGASDYKRLYESGIVTVTNPEVFNDYFENAPSMSVLFSHCGNWELLGGFLGFKTDNGVKVNLEEEQIKVVFKALHNETANQFFLLNRAAALEKVGPSCQIEASQILRRAIKWRNDKNIFIYIADQYPYQGAHEIGDFMSQPTKVMLGGAGVAHKLGQSVVYLKMRRVERGHYEMTFIPICRNAAESTPEEIMRKYFNLLEEEIKETPYNWLWSHKRWK